MRTIQRTIVALAKARPHSEKRLSIMTSEEAIDNPRLPGFGNQERLRCAPSIVDRMVKRIALLRGQGCLQKPDNQWLRCFRGGCDLRQIKGDHKETVLR